MTTSDPRTVQLAEIEQDKTRWLTEIQQVAWRNYLESQHMLNAQLDKELRGAYGLGIPEYEVLVRLSEQPDHSWRMAELANDVGMSRSRLTHIISRMEARGWVRRYSTVEDGRGVRAEMTEEGWQLLKDAAHVHVAGVRRHMIDLLTDEEIQTLAEVFMKVNAHMRKVL